MSSTHDSTPDAAAPDTEALFGEVHEGLKRIAHRELGRIGAEGTVSTAELIRDRMALTYSEDSNFGNRACCKNYLKQGNFIAALFLKLRTYE